MPKTTDITPSSDGFDFGDLNAQIDRVDKPPALDTSDIISDPGKPVVAHKSKKRTAITETPSPSISGKVRRQFSMEDFKGQKITNPNEEASKIKKAALSNISSDISQEKTVARMWMPRVKGMLPSSLYGKVNSLLPDGIVGTDDKLDTPTANVRIIKLLRLQQQLSADKYIRDKTDAMVRNKIKQVQHIETTTVLSQILGMTQRNNAFFEGTFKKYLMTSIELKYKHIFVTKDILKYTKLMLTTLSTKLDTVKHNTSLPDTAKRSFIDEFTRVLKQRSNAIVADALLNPLRKPVINVLKRAGSYIKGRAIEKYDDLSGRLPVEYNREIGEKGKTFKEKARYHTQVAFGKLKHVTGTSTQTYGHADMSPGTIDPRKPKGHVANIVHHATAMAHKPHVAENMLSKHSTDVVPFDVITRRSIIDVIPGFLSKIHHQSAIIAKMMEFSSKQKLHPSKHGAFDKHVATEELIYNRHVGDFTDKKTFEEHTKRHIFGSREQRTKNLQSIVKQFHAGHKQHGGTDEAFKEALPDLIRFLTNISKHVKVVKLEHIKRFLEGKRLTSQENDYLEAVLADVPKESRKRLVKVIGTTFFTDHTHTKVDSKISKNISHLLQKQIDEKKVHAERFKSLSSLGEHRHLPSMIDPVTGELHHEAIRDIHSDVDIHSLGADLSVEIPNHVSHAQHIVDSTKHVIASAGDDVKKKYHKAKRVVNKHISEIGKTVRRKKRSAKKAIGVHTRAFKKTDVGKAVYKKKRLLRKKIDQYSEEFAKTKLGKTVHERSASAKALFDKYAGQVSSTDFRELIIRHASHLKDADFREILLKHARDLKTFDLKAILKKYGSKLRDVDIKHLIDEFGSTDLGLDLQWKKRVIGQKMTRQVSSAKRKVGAIKESIGHTIEDLGSTDLGMDLQWKKRQLDQEIARFKKKAGHASEEAWNTDLGMDLQWKKRQLDKEIARHIRKVKPVVATVKKHASDLKVAHIDPISKSVADHITNITGVKNKDTPQISGPGVYIQGAPHEVHMPIDPHAKPHTLKDKFSKLISSARTTASKAKDDIKNLAHSDTDVGSRIKARIDDVNRAVNIAKDYIHKATERLKPVVQTHEQHTKTTKASHGKVSKSPDAIHQIKDLLEHHFLLAHESDIAKLELGHQILDHLSHGIQASGDGQPIPEDSGKRTVFGHMKAAARKIGGVGKSGVKLWGKGVGLWWKGLKKTGRGVSHVAKKTHEFFKGRHDKRIEEGRPHPLMSLAGLAGKGANIAGGVIAKVLGVEVRAVKAIGRGALNLVNALTRTKQKFVDVYRKGEVKIESPLMKGLSIKEGKYVYANGKPVKNSYSITGPVFDKETQQLVISADDIKHGLVDHNDRLLKETSLMGAGVKLAGKAVRAYVTILKGGMKLAGKVLDKGTDALSSLFSHIPGLKWLGKKRGPRGEGVAVDSKTLGNMVTRHLVRIITLLKPITKHYDPKGTAHKDRPEDKYDSHGGAGAANASGGVVSRAGEKLKDKAKEKTKAVLDKAKKGTKEALKAGANKILKHPKVAAAAAGGGVVGSVLSKVKEKIGGKKEGEVGPDGQPADGDAATKGGLGAAAVMGGAKLLKYGAKGAWSLAKKLIPRLAGRAALAAGAGEVAGGVATGAGIGGALTTGASAIGAALAAPVVAIPALVVGTAGAGYGVYRFLKGKERRYKIMQIRNAAYKVSQEDWKPLAELEDDLAKSYSPGKNDSNMDIANDHFKGFSLDPKNKDHLEFYKYWYFRQFLPIFKLSFIIIKNRYKLDFADQKKMTDDQITEYSTVLTTSTAYRQIVPTAFPLTKEGCTAWLSAKGSKPGEEKKEPGDGKKESTGDMKKTAAVVAAAGVAVATKKAIGEKAPGAPQTTAGVKEGNVPPIVDQATGMTTTSAPASETPTSEAPTTKRTRGPGGIFRDATDKAITPKGKAGVDQLKKGTPGLPDKAYEKGPAGLGDSVSKYESGKKGVESISSGKGDPGGASYGKYQLASKGGSASTLARYLKMSGYDKQFEKLSPGSPEFNKKWTELAKGDPKFAETQHDFIKKTHYDPAIKAAAAAGFNVNDKGIQEAIWSGSIQHGGVKEIIARASKTSGFDKMSPADQIKAFYKERETYSAYYMRKNGASAGTIANASTNRYKDEIKDVLALSGKPTDAKTEGEIAVAGKSDKAPGEGTSPDKGGTEGTSGSAVAATAKAAPTGGTEVASTGPPMTVPKTPGVNGPAPATPAIDTMASTAEKTANIQPAKTETPNVASASPIQVVDPEGKKQTDLLTQQNQLLSQMLAALGGSKNGEKTVPEDSKQILAKLDGVISAIKTSGTGDKQGIASNDTGTGGNRYTSQGNQSGIDVSRPQIPA